MENVRFVLQILLMIAQVENVYSSVLWLKFTTQRIRNVNAFWDFTGSVECVENARLVSLMSLRLNRVSTIVDPIRSLSMEHVDVLTALLSFLVHVRNVLLEQFTIP